MKDTPHGFLTWSGIVHHFWILILCLAIVFPLILPFFTPGMIDTFDGYLHQYRIAAFHTSVLQGVIPPRWSSFLAYGWGTPVFSFNWSLPYWMAEPFLFVGFSLSDAHKAVIISSVILLYASSFYLYFTWFGVWSALAGATMMTWGLYYMYTLYTTGALGTLVGVIFWPLLFLSIIYASRQKSRIAIVLGSIAVFGTMLSHQILFLMIMPVYLCFVFVMNILYKNRYILQITLLSICIGLSLSAYFWLPAIVEKSYINISTTEMSYQSNFIDPWVLLLQPKLYEVSGTYWWQQVYGKQFTGIGWSVYVVIGLTLVYLVCTKKRPYQNKKTMQVIMMVLFLVFLLVSLLCTTSYTIFLWRLIPLLASFIYPVRFYMLALFCASTLSALYVYSAKNPVISSIGIVCLTIGLNMYGIPQVSQRLVVPDATYFDGNSTSDMGGEFLPTVTSKDHMSGKEPWKRVPVVRISEGFAKIEAVKKSVERVFFVVHATDISHIIINQHYFPGWVVYDNKKSSPITITQSGEMQITVEKGRHEISTVFTNTPIRTVGNSISVLSVVLLFMITFHKRSFAYIKRHISTIVGPRFFL